MRIEACFDSHVHWQASGEFSERLKLDSLTGPEQIPNLQPERHHFRAEWLLGFGWDDSKWEAAPHRKFIDKRFPNTPVALQRCDGHAMWLNTEALQRIGLMSAPPPGLDGGRFEVDENGELTGVLIDRACDSVHAMIPKATNFEVRRFLLKGAQLFNEAGFTHVRDMTCDEQQWNEAVRLDQAGLLTLAIEEYFWLRSNSNLDAVLDLFARAAAEPSPNLRVKGVKVFFDGALGSEGALLSRCYHGRSHSGLRLWSTDDLSEVFIRCWQLGAAVSVHTIGDAAVDEVVDLALKLKDQGHSGELHLEHVELIRPETIDKMKKLKLECHLQPTHWLSDRLWLDEKLGDLARFAFPWRRLQEAEVSFDFGSDAPIEAPGLARTFQALRESAEAGIPRLLGSPASYMGHKDLAWAPNSYTVFAEERLRQVVFRGEHLL